MQDWVREIVQVLQSLYYFHDLVFEKLGVNVNEDNQETSRHTQRGRCTCDFGILAASNNVPIEYHGKIIQCSFWRPGTV